MRKKLGEILIDHGVLTRSDVDAVLAAQHAGDPSRIGDMLLTEGKVTPMQLARALAEQSGLPLVELEQVSPHVAALVPMALQREYCLVPFKEDGPKQAIHVAVADPTTRDVLADLEFKVGRSLKISIAARDEIESVHSALQQDLSQGVVLEEDDEPPRPAPPLASSPRPAQSPVGRVALKRVAVSPGGVVTELPPPSTKVPTFAAEVPPLEVSTGSRVRPSAPRPSQPDGDYLPTVEIPASQTAVAPVPAAPPQPKPEAKAQASGLPPRASRPPPRPAMPPPVLRPVGPPAPASAPGLGPASPPVLRPVAPPPPAPSPGPATQDEWKVRPVGAAIPRASKSRPDRPATPAEHTGTPALDAVTPTPPAMGEELFIEDAKTPIATIEQLQEMQGESPSRAIALPPEGALPLFGEPLGASRVPKTGPRAALVAPAAAAEPLASSPVPRSGSRPALGAAVVPKSAPRPAIAEAKPTVAEVPAAKSGPRPALAEAPVAKSGPRPAIDSLAGSPVAKTELRPALDSLAESPVAKSGSRPALADSPVAKSGARPAIDSLAESPVAKSGSRPALADSPVAKSGARPAIDSLADSPVATSDVRPALDSLAGPAVEPSGSRPSLADAPVPKSDLQPAVEALADSIVAKSGPRPAVDSLADSPIAQSGPRPAIDSLADSPVAKSGPRPAIDSLADSPVARSGPRPAVTDDSPAVPWHDIDKTAEAAPPVDDDGPDPLAVTTAEVRGNAPLPPPVPDPAPASAEREAASLGSDDTADTSVHAAFVPNIEPVVTAAPLDVAKAPPPDPFSASPPEAPSETVVSGSVAPATLEPPLDPAPVPAAALVTAAPVEAVAPEPQAQTGAQVVLAAAAPPAQLTPSPTPPSYDLPSWLRETEQADPLAKAIENAGINGALLRVLRLLVDRGLLTEAELLAELQKR